MFVSQHVWVNKAQKVLLQKIVSFVPIIGPILSDVVTIFWPAPDGPTPEEQFDVIKAHIRELINETVAEKLQGYPHMQAGRTTGEFADEQAITVPALACPSAFFSITADSNHNSMALTVGYNGGKSHCSVWHTPIQSVESTMNNDCLLIAC